MSSGKGPLYQLQVEVDGLKKEVDAVENQVEQQQEDGASAEKTDLLYQSCVKKKIDSSSMLLQAHQLLQVNEPIKVQNFEVKKKEEIQRIETLQNRLNALMDQLEMSSDEVEHLRSLRDGHEIAAHKQEDMANHEQDHDEDDIDEEDYTDEEEDEDAESELYEAVHAFEAERDEDLSIQPGDILAVIRKQQDGWWEVRDADDNTGMVPSTFLQEYEDQEDEESTLQEDTGTKAVQDEPAQGEADSPRRSGKDLWKGIKDAVNEPTKTDVTDVLAALGAIPAGFRPSTLCRLLSGRDEYTLKNAVLPAFTESNLGLQDLHWDPTLNQIRPVITRVLRTCRLWSCRMIPLAGSGVEVLSRHIRLSLFDGTNVLSNIHTVRANCSVNSPKLWTFSPRVSGILPSLLDGTCTVRSDITHSSLGILFELGITYIRTKTGERAELSCGWVFFKLFDEQGNPMPNRTYELPVNGGTPFEKGVEVDPSISRRASTNRFRTLLAANKQPKLIIKLGTPNNVKKKFMNLLPANIVLPACYCELVSFYRRMLADALTRDRLSPRDADPISCPVLSSFPEVLMLTDVMDALRSAWADKVKTLRRGDKRDKENMKTKFRSVFLETGYVFLHSSSLPSPQWAHPQVEQERSQKIFQQLQVQKSATTVATSGTKLDPSNAVLKTLLAANVEHTPFDMEELNFNLLQDHRKELPGVIT